jgi:hypothetical protein
MNMAIQVHDDVGAGSMELVNLSGKEVIVPG